MRITQVVTAIVGFALPLVTLAQSQTFDVANAHQAINTFATVCGYVTEVHLSAKTVGQPTFINMGGLYPNHRFTAVIWGNSLSNVLMDTTSLSGSYICVQGLIESYKGKPSVIVSNSKQLKIK